MNIFLDLQIHKVKQKYNIFFHDLFSLAII